MSRTYSEIHLHLTWHTKDNEPHLVGEVEKTAWDAIRKKAAGYAGVILREVGGIEDHVHVVVSIEPTVLISDLVGQLKGYSSWAVNRTLPHGGFAWQPGFGTGDSDWVTAYARNQKERHAKGRLFDRLGRTTAPDAPADAALQAPSGAFPR
ncbi:MAG: IS200/IS605 family transposase [Gemmataceae bacterium]|nr:IS200/IS605 family transposase [Gemmataceae bacterium]